MKCLGRPGHATELKIIEDSSASYGGQKMIGVCTPKERIVCFKQNDAFNKTCKCELTPLITRLYLICLIKVD
ncbi:hypothetical protein KIN20_013158 [Parelaphostrongylus tenuis]|uniref:Uncharacterized protein n=1 Tax=Parelaphostrongylus tenuis TaxID=148309 RepID=A0AAD5N1R8_PARTN|nr:hypothetical protein KIN20_013158 [Parelaphostrongylus tenuis]